MEKKKQPEKSTKKICCYRVEGSYFTWPWLLCMYCGRFLIPKEIFLFLLFEMLGRTLGRAIVRIALDLLNSILYTQDISNSQGINISVENFLRCIAQWALLVKLESAGHMCRVYSELFIYQICLAGIYQLILNKYFLWKM